MKKTKFFALAGLATLAVISVFGTKPTRKFTNVTNFKDVTDQLFSSGASTVLTTSGTVKTCQIKVGTAGSALTLFTSGGTTVRHI
jgi:hypothetical protein